MEFDWLRVRPDESPSPKETAAVLRESDKSHDDLSGHSF
jgi:hypothetical protein